jgi:hypothetical protein
MELLAVESNAQQVTENHQGGYWLLRALLHRSLKRTPRGLLALESTAPQVTENTKGVTGS